MWPIINILLSTVAPIISVALLGMLLDRIRPIDPRSLSPIIIYLATPALVFEAIANSTIGGAEVRGLILFGLLLSSAITLIAWLISRWSKMDRLTAGTFVLTASLINVVNYGFPLNELAFGQAGLERVIVVSMPIILYANTVGVFLASWGQASIWQAVRNTLVIPLPYAAALGLVVNMGQIAVPAPIMDFASILGQASIPLMLIILGIQISRTTLDGQWKVMMGAASIRLMGGAVVGLILAYLLGLEGVSRQVAIVEAAMPTAVLAGVLATEFNDNAQLVSSIILLSTLLSIITLPIIIFLVS